MVGPARNLRVSWYSASSKDVRVFSFSGLTRYRVSSLERAPIVLLCGNTKLRVLAKAHQSCTDRGLFVLVLLCISS